MHTAYAMITYIIYYFFLNLYCTLGRHFVFTKQKNNIEYLFLLFPVFCDLNIQCSKRCVLFCFVYLVVLYSLMLCPTSSSSVTEERQNLHWFIIEVFDSVGSICSCQGRLSNNSNMSKLIQSCVIRFVWACFCLSSMLFHTDKHVIQSCWGIT